jgi:hypothetical protein
MIAFAFIIGTSPGLFGISSWNTAKRFTGQVE